MEARPGHRYMLQTGDNGYLRDFLTPILRVQGNTKCIFPTLTESLKVTIAMEAISRLRPIFQSKFFT